MNNSNECPKCNGSMSGGRLQQIGNHGNSPIVWAPDGEPPFPVAGSASPRKELKLRRCDNCGFIEMYAN